MGGLIREAVRLYMREVEWRRLERYGRRRARDQGIAPKPHSGWWTNTGPKVPKPKPMWDVHFQVFGN